MAMTNAERQARYRARLKAKETAGGELGAEIEAFRQACSRDVAVTAAESGPGAYGLSDLLVALLDGDRDVRGLQGPLLAKVLGLPSDPWPLLTGDALQEMIGSRGREARRLGLPVGLTGDVEMDFVTKLTASRNRAWLLQEEVAEAA